MLTVRCLAVAAGSERTPVGDGGMDGNPSGMDVSTSAKFPHAEFFPPPPAPRGPSLWLARLVEDRRELVRFWPVVQNMVVQELRVRYQRSILGFVWTLLNPLLMMVILSWVFSHLIERDPENYPLFLFAGMVPWSFLSISLNECAFSIIQNEGLIRKIYLPKLVFPAGAGPDRSGDVHALARCAVLAVVAARRQAVVVDAAFCRWRSRFWPCSRSVSGLIVATANTFYRDCGHLISVILAGVVLRHADPLSDRDVRETAQWRLRLNPAFYFIELFHEILYAGRWPRVGPGRRPRP